jgi:ATP-binding cassette subfamily B protein
MHFLKDNWKSYILYLITLISLPLQNVAMPHYYGEVINSLKDSNLPRAKYLFILLLGIWILIQAFSIGISFVDNYISPKFHAYIRQYFFELIVDRYNQNYQELKIGTILTKLIKLPWILDDITSQIQRFLLTNIILIISNFVYLYRHHYILGIMYLGCIGIVFIMARFYFNSCNNSIKKLEGLYDECNEEIEDTLQNLLSIYTARKINDEQVRINKINQQTRFEQFNAGICSRKFRIYFSIVNIFLFLALNYVAYKLFLQNKLKVASLVSIFILNYTILGTLMGLFESSKDFMSLRSHIEIIEKFINELPKVDTTGNKKKISNPDKIDIVFKDIGYTPIASNNKIYDKFNLRIYPKTKVAIIGNAGCGKSTCAKLLLRLHTYQEGNIFINGTALNQIDIDDLRDKIVYIPQNPKLFNRTLWENISYGLPSNITQEDVLKFLHDNDFLDMEKEFKKRMNDKVGKQGSSVSGGQRSIIWMIRAVLKNASLIILDEPEASLDPLNRESVKKMINVISQNRGLIIITHDMNMTEGMDRVIKLEKGKIINDMNNKNNNNNNNNSNSSMLHYAIGKY